MLGDKRAWQGDGTTDWVAIDKQGALPVADDVGNTLWRVAGQDATASASR